IQALCRLRIGKDLQGDPGSEDQAGRMVDMTMDRAAFLRRPWYAKLRLVLPITNPLLDGMRLSPSKALAVGLVLVFCAFGAEQASAASKKQPFDGSSVPNIMVDEGTPIIMQGLERPKRASQGRRDTSKETER